jgi:putative intracellular protease/amidase
MTEPTLRTPSRVLKDWNLGKILVSFHESGRPTGIICHGPIVLLAALHNPDAFVASLIANDGKTNSLAAGWPHAGYRVTVFSTGEEQQIEGPNGLVGGPDLRHQRGVVPE